MFSVHHSARLLFYSQHGLIIVWNPANDGGVIRKLHNRILSMSGIAVMDVQSEQEGAGHTALGGSGLQHQSVGGVTTNPNCLGSICEFQSCRSQPIDWWMFLWLYIVLLCDGHLQIPEEDPCLIETLLQIFCLIFVSWVAASLNMCFSQSFRASSAHTVTVFFLWWFEPFN